MNDTLAFWKDPNLMGADSYRATEKPSAPDSLFGAEAETLITEALADTGSLRQLIRETQPGIDRAGAKHVGYHAFQAGVDARHTEICLGFLLVSASYPGHPSAKQVASYLAEAQAFANKAAQHLDGATSDTNPLVTGEMRGNLTAAGAAIKNVVARLETLAAMDATPPDPRPAGT